jgi:hypothetical protein
MLVRIQVIIEPAGETPVTAEIACIDRDDLDAGSIGLHLSEARLVLEGLQGAMVDAQVTEFLGRASRCPDCGSHLSRNGSHRIIYRSVFGKLGLDSPRFYSCGACSGSRRSASPLAALLVERSSPELQYLETKFASLMSFGLTTKVLDEFLPVTAGIAPSSVRRWTQRTAKRIEHDRRAHPARNTDPRDRPTIPAASPIKAIGIDGGYIRLAGRSSRQDGWFEVMVGKTQRHDRAGRCFAYVHRLEPDPAGRMQEFLRQEGIGAAEPVTFLSDGGMTVRLAHIGYRMRGETVLDWFHIAMRLQNLIQLSQGLPDRSEHLVRAAVLAELDRVKWHLWHGCAFLAVGCLEELVEEFDTFDEDETRAKLAFKLQEFLTYIENNRTCIVDYGDRHRHGEPIASSFVESGVNQVVAKRFVKKQQMAWTDAAAHDLLQIRTAVLNGDLRHHFEQWYPSMAAGVATRGSAP